MENRGFWALEAPPKRENERIQRGPIYRLAGHWPAFECRMCVQTHRLFCSRTQGLRSTVNNC